MKTGVKYSAIGFFFLFCYIEAAFRCDYRYSTAANGWLKHYVIPATWADANLRCTLQGARLASPLKVEMETEMKNIMRKFFTSESEVFTGFHATYSRGNFYSTEGVPLSKMHIAWAEKEPNNVGNNENCITLNVNGEMADRSCDEPRPYICFRSADMKTEVNKCGTIDPEYELDEATDTCYKFHSVARTFSGAHFACSAEGGHLAIIKSDVEAAVLKKVFAKYPVAKILGSFKKDIAFVGFHGWAESSDWRTIHGQTLQEAGYSKFASGEPSNSTTGEFCGGICRSALLNDLACEKPIAFICQKKRDFPPVC